MKVEAAIYVALVALLAGLIGVEGKRNTELQAQVALTPAQLWKKLANSQTKLQIIDARTDLDEFEDVHIPGAIPFPGCELAKTPDAAVDRIYPYLNTVVVTEDGDKAAFDACAAKFTVAWNLAGGMSAWEDEALPEDSGEYVPPKASAGGGCL